MGSVLRIAASSAPEWYISFHFAKFCHPDIPARSASLSTLPCQCPTWVTYDQLRKKDVSPLNRSIMKKQAHYTPDTPIKASAQAAGYLREDFRDLDHEESWILLLNGANLPLAKKMITVGTGRPPTHHQGSADVQRYRDHPLPQPSERKSRPECL